jgi:hypothetical protein
MFHRELLELLFQVVKSWQVIAVTVALVLYMSLVGYAARTYHRPSYVSKSKPQKTAKKAGKKSKKTSKSDTTPDDEPLIIEE